jgi:hypothetical protein
MFGKKDKKMYAIIFDIGSGSVGGAVVEFSSNEKIIPEILYALRTPISYQKHLRPDRFLNEMLISLNSVSQDIEKNGLRKLKSYRFAIEDIFCVFSSPWYAAQTKILKLKRREPFTLTAGSIMKIIARADSHFRKTSEVPGRNQKEEDMKLIERNAIQISLNEYPTEKPFGKKARSADIALYLSMISNDVYIKTRDTLKNTFNTDSISYHSFALSSFSALRDVFASEKNFLIMDISGELTDILLVREGVLLETISFPLGKNFILRYISESLDTIPEEAHSLIRAYLENKGDGGKSSKFDKILLQMKDKWLAAFRKALSDLGEGLPLPRTIFLTADIDLGNWFAETINNDDFSKNTLAEAPFTVVLVKDKQLEEYVHTQKGVPSDFFIALESIFFQNVLHD